MLSKLEGKTAVVLSDNEGLSRVIELALEKYVRVVRLPNPPGQVEAFNEPGDLHLIVLAMSSPASEPIIALARASLVNRIGQVPILIISDKPFQSNPADRIVHLNFPFTIDGLYTKVEEIMTDLPVSV